MIKQIWKNYHRYLNLSRKESFLAFSFGILGAFFETFSIYLLANLITNIDIEKSNFQIKYLESIFLNKNIIIIIFLLSAVFSALIYYLSNKYIVKAKCKIERLVREEITDLTLNIRWEYFLKISQGDISKSIISEGQNISEGYMYFLQSWTYSLIAITYFIVCLIVVPDTFLILVIYGFLAYRIYIYFSKQAILLGNDLSSITSNIGVWTASIFNNLKYIRTISKDKLARNESKEIFLKFSNSYAKAMLAKYKSKFVTEILTILFIFLAVIYIIITKSTSSNLILSLSLFIRMSPKIYNAQSRLLDSLAMISWPKLHYEKISWAKKYNQPEELKVNKDFKFSGSIIFNSVSFSYPNSETLIKDLNFEINQKESIGITGKSGSGKSTLLDLLTGIIKPKEGNIFISGKNMNNININSWRQKIGVVMQENYFKNDSIAANISLGEANININKIKKSLQMANAWDLVKNLPNGIHEVIYDRGARFSGGERQKLALARALYADPKILILDEPTTGLDKNSENEIIFSIQQLLGSMIIIIISHKPNVVKICDKVMLLKGKKLISI
ncbi:ABC transporter ATP-binding protein [uncultured Prochlorococcus sp.]|uniref:ATP-binding cassette domain-containing protein n=1 Tax=uncultured Prochlorococcus sp. TaxID=159733 RepID=UPI002589D2EE|nr:ABC transporter ATP-binding protein [uncultured Prochlorococcus sp.]